MPAPENSNRLCVLIADATPMACSLLADGLHRYSDLKVVACALNSPELPSVLERCAPDVALISAVSEGGGSERYDAAAAVRATNPGSRIVFLLDHSDREAVVEAFRAGACGVFCRSTYTLKSLRRCVESVAHGQVWANSKELGYVLDDYRQTVHVRLVNADGIALLTPREQDVYHLGSEGLMNREIAEQLGLSERTVKNYMFHIFDKLGVSTRVELVLHATAQELKSSGKISASAAMDSILSSSAD